MSATIIEPRLIRTPGGLDSGKPEDIRNPKVFVTAWGTETWREDALEPVRDALFVTRTVDRGLSFERVQAVCLLEPVDGFIQRYPINPAEKAVLRIVLVEMLEELDRRLELSAFSCRVAERYQAPALPQKPVGSVEE